MPCYSVYVVVNQLDIFNNTTTISTCFAISFKRKSSELITETNL